MVALIISADDYGQSAAIDQAIVALIRQGRLTATSCMSLSPRWPSAAKLLTAEVRRMADIGLHLDFTQYSQTLRHQHPQLVMRSLLRSLDKQQIRANIAQQLDSFEAALDAPPDYVDGHQHVHQLPQIRDLLLQELQARYEGQLPWIRISRPQGDGLKGNIIAALGANRLQQHARARGFRTSDLLLGVYGFDQGLPDYGMKLQRWLNIAKSEAEQGRQAALMCHPGMSLESDNINGDSNNAQNKTDAVIDPIAQARPMEYQALSSLAFGEMLQNLAIQPERGSRMLKVIQERH
ncbi:ChbG/HpnK family deacetylase [Methylobacillus glycogenes]|uniref:ChbG/HpnK family deacetylase n=1 Tax=Methylobacillus glycogenes TaxID=406 RepID=UPI00046F895F|nr:ChbG/HpnK family deacetylase [Methylobacillus glycogenes]